MRRQNFAVHEIATVMELVQEKYIKRDENLSLEQIRQACLEAVTEAAELYRDNGITVKSVQDKFGRQLRPDIQSRNHFYKLLSEWLQDDSVELLEILLNHTSDPEVVEKVRDLDPREDPNDVLAQEFGLSASEKTFREGKESFELHLKKERNHQLITRAKKQWNLEYNSNVRCSVCLFSFSERYGNLGDGFIEAHHIIAMSSLAPDTLVSMKNLAPVCSNCHRMLHWKRNLSIEELKAALSTKLT